MIKELNDMFSFKKVNEAVYIAEVNGDDFNEIVSNIAKSFINNFDIFSPLMDVSIGEELISRIIADQFIRVHKDIILSRETGVVVNCTIKDISYKVSIANNETKLGGVIYGILS